VTSVLVWIFGCVSIRKSLFDFSLLTSLDLDSFLNSALVGCSNMVCIVVQT
jgi:hypothetical protein